MLCEWASKIKVIRVKHKMHKIKINMEHLRIYCIKRDKCNELWNSRKMCDQCRTIGSTYRRWWQRVTRSPYNPGTYAIDSFRSEKCRHRRHRCTREDSLSVCVCVCEFMRQCSETRLQMPSVSSMSASAKERGQRRWTRTRNYCQRHGGMLNVYHIKIDSHMWWDFHAVSTVSLTIHRHICHSRTFSPFFLYPGASKCLFDGNSSDRTRIRIDSSNNGGGSS